MRGNVKPKLVPVWEVREYTVRATAYLEEHIRNTLDDKAQHGADPKLRPLAEQRMRDQLRVCPLCLEMFYHDDVHRCRFTCRRCVHGHKALDKRQPCCECYMPVHYPQAPPTKWEWCEGR